MQQTSLILLIGYLIGIPLLSKMATKERWKILPIPQVVPNENDVIVLSNAAFRIADDKTSFGFILNSKWNIACAGAIQGPYVFFSKEAEVRAILIALIKVKERGFLKACILSDAKEVVQAINGVYDRTINSIVLDIISMASNFLHISFKFITRSFNSAAHLLAKMRYSFNQNFCWNRNLEG